MIFFILEITDPFLKPTMKPSILIILFFSSIQLFGQLSDGAGELKRIAEGSIEIYVPKYFQISETPIGLIHNTSKTMVYIIKVPQEYHEEIKAGRGGQFLVDASMQNVVVENDRTLAFDQVEMEVDIIKYEISGIKFERINSYREHKGEIYLLMANYAVSLQNQVYEEVSSIYGSIRFIE